MRQKVVLSGFICGLILIAVVLALPRETQAAGANEVETNFYTCPGGATSLTQCTWNGMRLMDCSQNIVIDGSLTGNYKMSHSESCNTASQDTNCFWNPGGYWDPCLCLD